MCGSCQGRPEEALAGLTSVDCEVDLRSIRILLKRPCLPPSDHSFALSSAPHGSSTLGDHAVTQRLSANQCFRMAPAGAGGGSRRVVSVLQRRTAAASEASDSSDETRGDGSVSSLGEGSLGGDGDTVMAFDSEEDQEEGTGGDFDERLALLGVVGPLPLTPSKLSRDTHQLLEIAPGVYVAVRVCVEEDRPHALLFHVAPTCPVAAATAKNFARSLGGGDDPRAKAYLAGELHVSTMLLPGSAQVSQRLWGSASSVRFIVVQPCDSWSGGCGQAVTQTCCHMVNVLNDHLSDPQLSLIRASYIT